MREALKSLATESPFFRRLYVTSILSENAQDILGKHLAAHCEFRYNPEGKVELVCDDFLWASEVRMRKWQILQAVGKLTGIDVGELKVSVEYKVR